MGLKEDKMLIFLRITPHYIIGLIKNFRRDKKILKSVIKC